MVRAGRLAAYLHRDQASHPDRRRYELPRRRNARVDGHETRSRSAVKRDCVLSAIIVAIVRALLSLRYRIEVSGLDEIGARGTEKILFLPSHPSLLDPVMVIAVLSGAFAPYSVADQDGGTASAKSTASTTTCRRARKFWCR